MRKIIILYFISAAILIGCRDKKSTLITKGDNEFEQLSEEFIAQYLSWRPEYSVSLGLHEFDGKTSDLRKSSIENELVRLRKYEQILNDFDTTTLSPRKYYDFQILRLGIKNEIFQFDDLESFTKNPMTYVGRFDLSTYIKRNFAPLEERVKSIISIEDSISILFTAAKINLADSLPKPFIETAIQIANGSIEFLRNDLVLAIRDLNNDSLKAIFKISNEKAISKLKSFIEYLEKEKLPKSNNKYALGVNKYQRMLNCEYVSLSPEKVLELGLKELAAEQKVFNTAARIINPNMKPIDVYKALQKEHPSDIDLTSYAAKRANIIKQFLVEKEIVTIPLEVNINVKETPTFLRFTGPALMDSPGPFEKKANEAFYYITPVDLKWTTEQKEDWLSMFNTYATDMKTIHEVYPGHYTHMLHFSQSSTTKIEKIFMSYALIEGWAHYSEKMMIDEGFGTSKDSILTAKYRLAQSEGSLLRLCRLCVSIKMHCNGMSVDEATKFFMDNLFYGEKPSQQEAIRGTWDPGYLYYSLGKLMMLKLREDYKKQEAEKFSLKHFHDLILGKGIPPVPILREQLLNDKNIWDKIL